MGTNSEKRPDQIASDCLYLKSVIDAMADPVTVVRPDYGVVLVNDRAKELFPSAAGEGGGEDLPTVGDLDWRIEN